MEESQFIEITYMNSKDKDLFKIGEKNVEKLAIQRVIPFSSILYFDTNYMPAPPVLSF